MSENVIGIFSRASGDIKIYKETLFEYGKPIEEAKEYGLSCNTCYYNLNGQCWCKQKEVLRKNNRKVLHNADFILDLDFCSDFDERTICEFYKSGAQWFKHLRPIQGDYAFSYPQYDNQKKKLKYIRCNSLCEALVYEIQIERDKTEKMKQDYLEAREFLNYFKSEIPELYRNMRRNYKELNKNE